MTTTTEKPKTVAADMPQRQIFPTLDELQNYLAAASERFSDFDSIPKAMPAMDKDEEGNFTGFGEAWGADGLCYVVAVLKNKGTKDSPSTVKAIVVYPAPTLEALTSSDAGTLFVQAIIDKELNHRAVRQLREAEDVATVADQIPFTMDGFISSSREAGGIMEAFNDLYKMVGDTLAAARPQWKKARLTKGELKKALESKGYALEYYAPLEEHGKDGSLFVAALDLAIKAAKRQGIDPTIFERWKESRDSRGFSADEEEEEELDLDSLADAMLTTDEAEGTDDEPTEDEAETTDSE